LNLFQQLATIPLFISYFFNVVDQHSIQAPFAYKFFNKLKESIKASNAIEIIEQERERFFLDNSNVTGDDFGAGSKVKHASRISSIARHGISSRKDSIFLHEIANIAKSEICIELGTSLGIATSYLANSKSVSRIYSFEGNEVLVKNAKKLFKKLNIDKVQLMQGNIDDELPAFLETIDTFDLVIIDANHTRNALINYYQLLKSKINPSGIIVIDDIRWSTGMYAGWRNIIQRQEVSISMEFLNKGLLFFEKGIQKQHYVLTI